MIKITDVKIRIVTAENSKLKAVASIIIDECFAVHDIKLSKATTASLLRCRPEKPLPANLRI